VRRFLLFLASLPVLALLLFGWGYLNARADPVVRSASVALPGWPKAARPVRAILLSDVHVGGVTMDSARLARIVGLGRAKELTLLNDHVTPAAALAMGLVNWVVEPDGVDAALAGIVDKAFHSSRTATGHAKRLLHASFHRDPRELIEDVMRAQGECMTSWEMEEANRAWDERREVRFYPPPGTSRP